MNRLTSSASWIVPYTMLVFGLETTFRSLHRKRFIHRKWWAVLLCVITVLIMILVTWLHSRLDSTVGWTGLFANVGLIIGSCVLFTYIVCATAITTQLIRTTSMDTSQRISATRVVYYLIVSSLIMVGLPKPSPTSYN